MKRARNFRWSRPSKWLRWVQQASSRWLGRMMQMDDWGGFSMSALCEIWSGRTLRSSQRLAGASTRAEKGGGFAAGQVGEVIVDVRAPEPVQQGSLVQRLDHGGDPPDGLLAMRQPAGDGHAAVAEPAGRPWLLECAVKGRVGQRIQRLGEGARHHFVRQRRQRDLRSKRLQPEQGRNELLKQSRQGRERRTGRRAGIRRDRRPEKLPPMAGLVAQFKAEHAGAGVRLEQE